MTATIEAKRLRSLFAYARQFASEEETKVPQLCLCEFREGELFATDRVGLVKIHVPGMARSELRVHVRDIPPLLRFLQVCGTEEVTILEHERANFFRVGDSLFGASCVRVTFPKLNKSGLEADRWWTVSKDLLVRMIRFLIASAEESDQHRLVFIPDEERNEIRLRVRGATGDDIKTSLPCVMKEKDNATKLPDEGFSVSYRYLLKVLSEYGREVVVPEEDNGSNIEGVDGAEALLEEGTLVEEEGQDEPMPDGVEGDEVLVDIGLNADKSGSSGFLFFQKVDGVDEYVTVLSWVE